ncbi:MULTISPECIES: hypothetical protein [unclassified Polynucleobacter]|uniref:TA system antitoxin ParD family protein n=1 Tax=unclassified Polynucleobacter TaxID=2640945 RepID=UPI0008B54A46|nr:MULTISPECIES: hypothetical protein [unclassified Polynucleobacter]OHC10090.1 MAG: hypothetical protein A2X74_10035 [Polynucleobacter sp. GWA2_45_21]HBK43579.1 hypothetical protein [Polynucleobacter sp.]
MSQLVHLNLSGHMLALLRKESNIHAIDQQVNFWVRLGKACIENPELPTTFVAECLTSLSEAKSKGFIPFIPRATD